MTAHALIAMRRIGESIELGGRLVGDVTQIAWANHTFNPFIGCTKVARECDNCYAERDFDHRYGKVKWGAGNPRMRTSPENWRKPSRWNARAAETGKRARVFCASLADVFDNEVADEWRTDLWDVINKTPHLDWLLLTKRIGNVPKMLPEELALRPNVWLGITVGTQEAADRDIPKLLRIRTGGPRWLSMEPLLEPVDLRTHAGQHGREGFMYGVDWVVVGGESGPGARPMEVSWALDIREQCRAAGVPFFFKQGSAANWPTFKDFETFPAELRVREFPRG